MVNELYFSSTKFKEKALNAKTIIQTNLTPQDAFLLLIEDVKFTDLDLFCSKIKDILELPLTITEIYDIIQKKEELTDEQKNIIYNIAISNIQFGSNVINPGNGLVINTSSWINHSINVAKVAKILSSSINNIDQNTAYVLGILHDIGRKFKTDMQHTIYGYEFLVSKGYENEARICLTHSHINGERCANNEPAVNGWSYSNGISTWDNSVNTDDLTSFLKTITYTDYDSIICIADLMATEKEILPIYERLSDITSKRKIDPINRKFFLTELINLLMNYLPPTSIPESFKTLIVSDDFSLEYLNQLLYNISCLFYDYFKSLEAKDTYLKNDIKKLEVPNE